MAVFVVALIVAAVLGPALGAWLSGNPKTLGFYIMAIPLTLFILVCLDQREQITRPSLVYAGVVPNVVWEKARRDSRLFDLMLVASYNKNLFEASKVLRADPLLIGQVGRNYYLGAVWGLDEEIALAEAQASMKEAR